MRNIQDSKELHKLLNDLQGEPWIRFRTKLVSTLVGKRRELGMSQKTVAEKMGTAYSSITRFESLAAIKDGKPVNPPNPTVKFIASYAAALGMDIEIRLAPSESHMPEK